MTTDQPVSSIDIEIKRAAQLSVTEICIGSLGHGFKIPLTGQILSLNQLAFLLNAINRDKLSKSSVFEISGIAAILKSFSPAGQKLGPMLSIVMQGFLYWLSISIFGINLAGQSVGAVFLSLWAFIQPLITLFMIYGFDLVKLIGFYKNRISEDYEFLAVTLFYAVFIFMLIKISVAVVMVYLSLRGGKEILIIGENKLSEIVIRQIPRGKQKNAVKAAFFDLFKPLFLLSFLLMLVFIWQIEGSFSQKIWFSLRPLATAFVLFYLLRSSWISKKMIELSLRSKTFARIYTKSKSAFEIVSAKMVRKD